MKQSGMVSVAENGKEGTVSILQTGEDVSASITVEQKLYQVVPQGVIVETRTAKLIDSPERILSLSLEKGQYLKGKIVVIQQTSPVVRDEPELFLLKRNEEVVRNSQGKAIWQYAYYTESLNDFDIILE